jgi:hypothetical protein
LRRNLLAISLILIAGLAVPLEATPLRVDINSEGRSDMRTVGWENWHPKGNSLSQPNR